MPQSECMSVTRSDGNAIFLRIRYAFRVVKDDLSAGNLLGVEILFRFEEERELDVCEVRFP